MPHTQMLTHHREGLETTHTGRRATLPHTEQQPRPKPPSNLNHTGCVADVSRSAQIIFQLPVGAI